MIQLAAEGYSGGMVLLWRANELLVDPITATAQEIHASVQVSQSSPPWLISFIYASTSYHSRKILWDNLQIFSTNHNSPWLLCGDFNEVTTSNEKFGGSPINTNRSATFNKCLHNINMIDLGFAGSHFT